MVAEGFYKDGDMIADGLLNMLLVMCLKGRMLSHSIFSCILFKALFKSF